ncbi:putative integral membrane protein [Beggiatoa alba B18LD]|uniref:Putative integral membrane protein n=1 Tax=Beggiatoa alba B18LD TaxID=395493 RepID=I3CJR0_9GAMM|nr:VanZ family protein [Beggiatoa alba]EIJ43853.1 putative integral membrane protein [Beggiatoa alba B18LD]
MRSYRYFCSTVTLCYLLVLVFLSLNPWVKPAANDIITGLSWDKLEHAFAYTLFAYLLFLTSMTYNVAFSTGSFLSILFVVAGLGGLLEIAQSTLTQTRSGSWDDAMANALGALLGCTLYRITLPFFRRWQLLNSSVL